MELEIIENYGIFILILARFFGMILFTPIFGQKTIPAMVRVGLSIGLTILMADVYSEQVIEFTGVVSFITMVAKEFTIGYVISYVFIITVSAIEFSGSFIDYQIGLAMAKLYDPGSNTSMSITGKLVDSMFMMMFFLSGAYLTLIRFTVLTLEFIPVGNFELNFSGGIVLVQMFGEVLTYAAQLVLPVLCAEYLVEIGVGIMTKVIPQINVFVINIQLKVALGFLMILALMPVFGSFCEKLIAILFENIEEAMIMFTG